MGLISKEMSIKKAHTQTKETFLAAIDLGSNSCRLHIGKITDDSHVLEASFSKTVSLAHMIKENSNKISLVSQYRAMKILKQYVAILQKYKPKYSRFVTTAACRMAINGQDFVKKINYTLAINLEIIDAKEEARLALLGCEKQIPANVEYVILIDLGGASTELIFAKRTYHNNRALGTAAPPEQSTSSFKIIDYASLNIGMLTLKDAYGSYLDNLFTVIAKNTAEQTESFITKNNIRNLIASGSCKFISSSSASKTIFEVHKLSDFKRVKRNKFCIMDIKALDNFAPLRNLGKDSVKNGKPKSILKNGLFIAGSAIISGVIDSIKPKEAYLTSLGVRDGLLQDIFNTHFKNK